MTDFHSLIREPNKENANQAYESIILKEIQKTTSMEEVNHGIANGANSQQIANSTLSTILDSTTQDVM